jgi:adenylate cyclase
MIFRDEIVGMLTVGEKKSGRLYNMDDIDLLTTLANQGAVAIENARMAEKMRDEEVVRANLARYLSPQVVEKVISKSVDVSLGGERKEVTVLISDIRGFTNITETQPPDRLVSILNEYFTEMAGIIFEKHGSLDKYVGDSIISVFGSFGDVKNSSDHALEASLVMMKRMGELNGEWEVKYDGFRMEIGIGIDRGEVFLGNVGSPDRMEFTVLGQTVNTASILSDHAGAGQILVTERVAEKLRPDFSLRQVPPLKGKKKNGEIKILEVLYL